MELFQTLGGTAELRGKAGVPESRGLPGGRGWEWEWLECHAVPAPHPSQGGVGGTQDPPNGFTGGFFLYRAGSAVIL